MNECPIRTAWPTFRQVPPCWGCVGRAGRDPDAGLIRRTGVTPRLFRGRVCSSALDDPAPSSMRCGTASVGIHQLVEQAGWKVHGLAGRVEMGCVAGDQFPKLGDVFRAVIT